MAVDVNTIVGLYVIYFNRAPDPSGLQFWAGQDITVEEMATAFAASPEAQSIYPFLASPALSSPDDFINKIYQNSFGRDAEPAGLEFWKGVLASDSSPEAIANFVLTVARGAQGTDFTTLQNRADAALDFTRQFTNAGIAFDTEVLATSRGIINTVDFTPESVDNAGQLTSQAITDIEEGGLGTTFTLLQQDAVLTAAASNGVAPPDKFLSTADDKIIANVNLGDALGTSSAVILDPSSNDNDLLTATIVTTAGKFQAPTIDKIETIQLTGTIGAGIDISRVTNAKKLEIITGDLNIATAENAPAAGIDLAEGYTGTLFLGVNDQSRDLKVNLNGTAAGTSIIDDGFPVVVANFKNTNANINLVVNKDSILQSNNPDKFTLGDANPVPDSEFLISGEANLTIKGGIAAARIDASALTGNLDITVTNPPDSPLSNIPIIVGGQGDDTFTLLTEDQIRNVTLNGGPGQDTLRVKISNAFTNALNNVTNVETIILEQPTTATATITTVDTLVASGQTLVVDASSFVTKRLIFNGAAETNGSFKIIGGNALAGDQLRGGAKDDILIGNGGNNTLTGGGGADTFVLNTLGQGVTTITDFTVADEDVIALSRAAFAGAPAVGATMSVNPFDPLPGADNVNLATSITSVANAAELATVNLNNVRFAYVRGTGNLFYDNDGNFAAGSTQIATLTGTPVLTGGNFEIIA